MTYVAHQEKTSLRPSASSAVKRVSAEDAEQRREVAENSACKPQRVMQVTWSLVAGGSEMYAYTIAANLDARRFQSQLCAIDKGGALEPEIRRRGIPYHIMHRRQGVDWKLMWRLYRLFKRERVEVIHTHHFNQLFYSLLGAKLCGARLVHMEHSVEFLKSRKKRWTLRGLALFCDKVLAIGGDGARVLEAEVKIPRKKLQIIRAGVDTAAYTQSQAAARAALGLAESDKVAVIVARLFPEKNHRMLLEAFAEVKRRLANAKLLIVGDGVEEAAIRQEISRLNLSDAVSLLGVRRDVPRLLAAADVFVLSSDREGLPIAVLEAMAAAKPVVATAVGDLPAVVKDRETGRVVAAKDAAAFAEALVEIFSDTSAAAAMGAKAREAARDYSLQTMMERFAALYASRD